MAKSGDVIGGKYRLVHPLGIGGMGAVWRAEHTALMQQVAIKLLDARGPAADRAVKRFQREAQIAAGIRHRNIVYISDFGTDGGAPYLVMELLNGVPLSERMVVGEPLGVATFLNLVSETLDGLSAVHAAGVVHRDMKPENIFLVRDGVSVFPKLLDFGVSRSTDRTQGHTITREGIVMGTPEYVSPEQARGRMADTRSDLYSLGVVMYEALAGRLPFQADNAADLIVAVLNAEAIPLVSLRPDLGKELSALVAKAMMRDPAERFQSTDEMRAAIEAVVLARPDLAERSLPRRYMAAPSPSTPTGTAADVTATSTGLRATEPQRVSGEPASFAERLGKKPRRVAAWSFAGLALIVGVTVTVTLWGADPKSQARAELGGNVSQGVVAAAAKGTENVVVEPSEVSIELFGVPEDAQVFADGSAIRGTTVQLAKNSGMHEISVRSPGREPWTVMHDSAEGGRYALSLAPAEPALPPVHAMAKKPERSERRSEHGHMSSSRDKKDSKLLRTPDF